MFCHLAIASSSNRFQNSEMHEVDWPIVCTTTTFTFGALNHQVSHLCTSPHHNTTKQQSLPKVSHIEDSKLLWPRKIDNEDERCSQAISSSSDRKHNWTNRMAVYLLKGDGGRFLLRRNLPPRFENFYYLCEALCFAWLWPHVNRWS